MVYCLISLSPIACGYLSFAVAKATRQDASNPNMSSKKNPDTGRIPTTRNWTQLVWKDCDSHVGVWDGVKRACKLDGFIEPPSGTWRKETVRLWASSFMISRPEVHIWFEITFLLRYNNWWCFCFGDCFCFGWCVLTVHLVCLFMTTQLLALLLDNCLNLVRYAFHQ